MLDRCSRDRLAERLRLLVTGRINNDQFVDGLLCSSSDRAILSVFEIAGWPLCDDLRTYRLRGRFAVSNEERRIAARAVIFLHSDFEYEWPETPRGTIPFWGMWGLGCYTSLGLLLAFTAGLYAYGGETSNGLGTAAIAALILASIVYSLATRKRCLEEECRFFEAGDFEAWPFIRPEDFDAACQKPRLLAGQLGA